MYVEEKKLGETNIDNVGKVLLEAADYIEWHGWCQQSPQMRKVRSVR
jgi:membrane-bound lytic murein transglycosylase B